MAGLTVDGTAVPPEVESRGGQAVAQYVETVHGLGGDAEAHAMALDEVRAAYAPPAVPQPEQQSASTPDYGTAEER